MGTKKKYREVLKEKTKEFIKITKMHFPAVNLRGSVQNEF
jgi:hypothetical protein